jgi:hypothetical protein
MAAKKQVRTRIKRSERKNIAVGQAHIKSTQQHHHHPHRPAGQRHHLAERRHRGLQGLS